MHIDFNRINFIHLKYNYWVGAKHTRPRDLQFDIYKNVWCCWKWHNKPAHWEEELFYLLRIITGSPEYMEKKLGRCNGNNIYMKKSDLLVKIQSGNSDLLLYIDGFEIQIYLLHSYTANPNGQKSKVFYIRLFFKILKVDKI